MQLTLLGIQKQFRNTPPKLLSEHFQMTEDSLFGGFIDVFDQEYDRLKFKILQEPKHLSCNVSDIGYLTCMPDTDFEGQDTLTMEVIETGLPQHEIPHRTVRTLALYVENVPDLTERYVIDSNGNFFEEQIPFMRQKIVVNANRSSIVSAGTIVLADPDTENFTVLARFRPFGNSSYVIKEVEALDIHLENYTSRAMRTESAYKIEFMTYPEEQGNMTLDFIAQTTDGAYTPTVTFEVYVLENPCVNGHCSHPTLGDQECNSTKRTHGFTVHGFQCYCNAGMFAWIEIQCFVKYKIAWFSRQSQMQVGSLNLLLVLLKIDPFRSVNFT